MIFHLTNNIIYKLKNKYLFKLNKTLYQQKFKDEAIS